MCLAAGKFLTWLQLSEPFLLTFSMQSMCLPENGAKSQVQAGEGLLLPQPQPSDSAVCHYRQAMILPEKPHLAPHLGGLSSGKPPNLSTSSAKAEGGRQTVAGGCSSRP